MPTRWVLVDPIAKRANEDAETAAPRAGRPLATAGFLSNNKQNATEVLEAIGRWVEAEHGLAVRHYLKLNASVPASPELVAQIAEECDIVITGSGDCGSCTSGSIHDGVSFRRLGLASAVLTSEAFVPLARMQAHALGDDDLELLVIPHPLGGISDDELDARCAVAVDGAAAWWKVVEPAVAQ